MDKRKISTRTRICAHVVTKCKKSVVYLMLESGDKCQSTSLSVTHGVTKLLYLKTILTDTKSKKNRGGGRRLVFVPTHGSYQVPGMTQSAAAARFHLHLHLIANE